MLSLEQALEQILTLLPPPSPQNIETIPLAVAINRICAEDIISPINVPSFDNSAMDGYAVRLKDLTESLTLPVVGKSFSGNPFNGEWPEKTAIRIMTGAIVPQGTDTVVMQENVIINNDNSITFNTLPKANQNIRRVGENIKQGDIVLNYGTVLNTVSLPLLASLGIPTIKVFPRLKVAILSTGDELVSVGHPLKEGQIYDSNRFTVKLILEKLNCEVLDMGILPDNETQIEQAFLDAQKQADLIITSGGVSVGEADFTKIVLNKIGQINFWKLAIKPGKPFAFGKIKNTWFCGLPGNPVSALVTLYQLVVPIIAKLSGITVYQRPPQFLATTTNALKKSIGRLDFQRGFYYLNKQGQLVVHSVGAQDSHLFSSFIHSNCFIVLEKERGNVNIGETVTIEPFNYLLS